MRRFVIAGAGPAGLTAAHQLAVQGFQPTVIERSHIVGGLARTECYQGYYFDMGGHRFYTKSAPVFNFWAEILKDDLVSRSRLSRIYYRGRFFEYPLKPLSVLRALGTLEALQILLSYAKWTAFPSRAEDTFQQWVTNRFGQRLFEVFFRSYTEKVWGISCSELRAEWAVQRIKNLSLSRAAWNMFSRGQDQIRTLIEEFHYPRLGPGMLWHRVREAIEQHGGTFMMNTAVHEVRCSGRRVRSVVVGRGSQTQELPVTDLISSMPITELVKRMHPSPPLHVVQSARQLAYRDFLTVCLIVKRKEIFPDNWIYVHDPELKVARIQNFKNWSPDMVPDLNTTSLGLEYFCQEGDSLWNTPDTDLIRLASRELENLGMARKADILDGVVYRSPRAYPVYDAHYRERLSSIKELTGNIENLHSIGRNGLYRYNNLDHAMLTAMYAVRNALHNEQIDLWSVNSDDAYLEEIGGSEIISGTQAQQNKEDIPPLATSTTV